MPDPRWSMWLPQKSWENRFNMIKNLNADEELENHWKCWCLLVENWRKSHKAEFITEPSKTVKDIWPWNLKYGYRTDLFFLKCVFVCVCVWGGGRGEKGKNHHARLTCNSNFRFLNHYNWLCMRANSLQGILYQHSQKFIISGSYKIKNVAASTVIVKSGHTILTD